MRRYVNILLTLLALAWVVYYAVRFVSLPYYGLSVTAAGIVMEAPRGAGIRPGDRVTSVNGHALQSAGGLQAATRVLAEGKPLRLEVERHGETREVRHAPVRRSHLLVGTQVGFSVLALLFIAIGALVVFRPTGKPGQLFFLFSICSALLMAHVGQSTGILDATVLPAALLFAPAFLLHFFLLFPHRHPLAERVPFLGWVLYVPPLLFLLMLQALEVATRVSVVPAVLVETLGNGAILFAVAYFLWAVLTFVDSYRRLKDPLEREKLRWLVWGVVVSIVPSMGMLALEVILGVQVPYFDVAALILLSLLPLSFGYAILSHRLMDIEVVLNRGLVYSTITVVLVVIFILVENVLAALSLELTGRSSFAVALGAAVIMAALVEPVKRRIQLFIDQLFFAYKARLREGLRDLAEELSFITDLTRMEHLLLRRLTDLAHVWRSALFLREEDGDGYVMTGFSGNGAAGKTVDATISRPASAVSMGGDGATSRAESGGASRGVTDPAPRPGERFDANDSLIVWLLREARPLSLESLPEAEFEQRVEAREVEILRSLDAAICLPLRLRSELIGFIVLSRRRNRELFNRDEIDLLHNLALKAAVDLTNARLQTRSRRLEEEVVTLREELLEGLRGFLASSQGAARDAQS